MKRFGCWHYDPKTETLEFRSPHWPAYWLPARELSTPTGLLDWERHLKEKVWCQHQVIHDLRVAAHTLYPALYEETTP